MSNPEKTIRLQEKRIRNKLKKVNVPELFYQSFLTSVPYGTSSVVDKLRFITPTPRGRGLTRVTGAVTEVEWNDLYQRAAAARQSLQGANRDTELRPAICAKVLADRMEELGVDSPVTYTIKRKRSTPASVIVEGASVEGSAVITPTPDMADTAINTPIAIDPVDDVDEVGADEQHRFHEDIKHQQG